MVQTGSFKRASSSLNNLSFELVELRAMNGPNPPVRCCNLHRTEGSSLDVWEYSPGEFEWQADMDQSACILSGRAQVDLADGRCLSLKAGAAFFLPRGLHGHWVVKETLRTVAVRDG